MGEDFASIALAGNPTPRERGAWVGAVALPVVAVTLTGADLGGGAFAGSTPMEGSATRARLSGGAFVGGTPVEGGAWVGAGSSVLLLGCL